MKSVAGIMMLAVALTVAAPALKAQSLVITLTLGPNQIGQVKTTQGITTRMIFPELVRDIICGDLYDPATGKGSFVVQRIDNDVFLKPVVAKAMSNLFIKTGEKGDHTYSFDLQIVAPEQAHRVVNVAEGSSLRTVAAPSPTVDTPDARHQADETLRKAQQQADQLVAKANQQASEIYSKALQRAEELDRHSAERAQQEVEHRFVRAMIQGVREFKTADTRVSAKGLSLVLDPRLMTFDDKSYLRYTIKNSGDKEVGFSALSLERRSGKDAFLIPCKVIQGRE